MALLLVTYELNTEGKDYKPFFKAIKDNSNGWWHYLDKTWVSNTSLSADAFARKLFPYITKKDHLLVFKLQKEHQGWLPEDAWKWFDDKNFN